MARILIISSQAHKELSQKQLALCIDKLKASGHDYQVEIIEAGTYEIPMVINLHQQWHAFDGYIALGLVLKKNKEHCDYIMSHISTCFTSFALNQIIVGNGIISGDSVDDLAMKIESGDPCLCGYISALNAVDCLIKLKKKYSPPRDKS